MSWFETALPVVASPQPPYNMWYLNSTRVPVCREPVRLVRPAGAGWNNNQWRVMMRPTRAAYERKMWVEPLTVPAKR